MRHAIYAYFERRRLVRRSYMLGEQDEETSFLNSFSSLRHSLLESEKSKLDNSVGAAVVLQIGGSPFNDEVTKKPPKRVFGTDVEEKAYNQGRNSRGNSITGMLLGC